MLKNTDAYIWLGNLFCKVLISHIKWKAVFYCSLAVELLEIPTKVRIFWTSSAVDAVVTSGDVFLELGELSEAGTRP